MLGDSPPTSPQLAAGTRPLGYARVSTYGKTLDSQLEQLRAAGCASRNLADQTG
jgi:hypothetical protein